jgi:hypothetical protein
MSRLSHQTTFDMIALVGQTKPVVGHFRLERATGDLAYAPTLFVVEQDGGGRVWPLASVACLYPADPAATTTTRETDR